jgi:broad specificity phosphatase PhoE
MPEPLGANDCLLYLVRHGATDNNETNPPRLQGRRTDAPLSMRGRQQAACTGRWLAAQGIEAIYASPLLRARQTAEEIARPQGLEVQVVDGLIEVDIGRWEGLTWPEVEARDPEAYRHFVTDASIHPYLGGENLQTVLDRAIPAIMNLMIANGGRRIAAVSHNVVNRAYLSHLMGIPLRRYRSIPQENCCVNLIRLSQRQPKLVTINAVGHLLACD